MRHQETQGGSREKEKKIQELLAYGEKCAKLMNLFLNLEELQLAALILALVVMLAILVSQYTREKDRAARRNMSRVANRKLLRTLFTA